MDPALRQRPDQQSDSGLALPTIRANDFVVRLNRAVQRATIYPLGHPTTRLAVGPFVAALSALFEQVSLILVHITRDKLVVACGEGQPEPVEAPWLSSWLSERGLASLTFSATLDEDDALALVTWLSQPATDQTRSPDLPGVGVAWREYSSIRFSDRAADQDETADALVLWQRVAHGLTEDWLDPGSIGTPSADSGNGHHTDNPVELARLVRRKVQAQEGTGIAVVADRLVKAGSRLATLDEPVRDVVRSRLAAFITERGIL